MSEQRRVVQESYCFSRSTLLVPDSHFRRFFNVGRHKKVGIIPLSQYLARLLDDPLLDWKLSHLKAKKWKKEYQAEGQELRRVNFYPEERDWGRLSAISNATGFSRCYIFVYLMLVDMRVIVIENSGTNLSTVVGFRNPIVFCSVSVDVFARKLTRTLQT